MWSRLRSYDGIVLALVVAALIDIALPIFVTLTMISIIGIPIAFALMALPTVAFVLGLAWLLQRASGLAGMGPRVVSIAIVLFALYALANHYNAKLETRSTLLMAGDIDAMTRQQAAFLGLSGDEYGWSDKNKTACDDLCLRLLITGAAKKVAIFPRNKDMAELKPDTEGKSFWLEQRGTCAAVQFQDDHEHVEGEDKSAPKAAEVMALNLAKGNCLIEGTAKLEDLDTLALAGTVARGDSDCGAGFSPGADTVSAKRLAIYQKAASGLSETYRRTATFWQAHPWILAPTIVGCTGLEMGGAFFRTYQSRNSEGMRYDSPKLAEVLTGKLGLSLAMQKLTAENAAMPIIVRALGASGSIDAPVHRVIEDFFEALRDHKATQEERALALRTLADPRIDPPRATWALARSMTEANDPALSQLADTLFARIKSTPVDAKENHPSYLGYLVSYLDGAVRHLPEAILKGRQADIEAIAHDESRRLRAPQSLERLIVFRRDALDTIVYLVKDAARIWEAGTEDLSSDAWRVPLRAGLRNLCLMGADAASRSSEVIRLLSQGQKPLGRYNTGLVASTLLSIGVTDDVVINVIGGLNSDSEKNNFRIWKSRLAKGKPDCD